MHAGTLDIKEFAWTAFKVAVLSTLVNFILVYVGKVIEDPPGFAPYFYHSVALFTVLGVFAASIGYAVLRYFVRDAGQANNYFVIVSIILLIISFYPDVNLPYSKDPDEAGWTYSIMINLMIMHVLTAGFVMYFFTKRPKG